MKPKFSFLVLKNFLSCFFLLEKNTPTSRNFDTFFCLFQKNREIKQLTRILFYLQKHKNKKKSSKAAIVFHVEDLLTKDFLNSLLLNCNLILDIYVVVINTFSSQNIAYHSNILNIYLVEKKSIYSLSFKNKYCNVVFNPSCSSFKFQFSGCYSVNSVVFDFKFLIFIVALLNSFLSKKYAKLY